MQKIFQIAGWLLLFAIAVLSLLPPMSRPVTSIPHSLEHLAIFVPTGLAFALGYSTRYLFRLVGLIAFTAAVELAQLWVPGRHSRFSDLIVNTLGLSIGVGLGFVVARRRMRLVASRNSMD
jgi:VanZ family protein